MYGDLEVKLTGREANKELKKTRSRTSRTANSQSSDVRIITLHEITPADIEEGSWKKWVKMTDLYEIGED